MAVYTPPSLEEYVLPEKCECPEHDCEHRPMDHSPVIASPALCGPCLFYCDLEEGRTS